MIECPTSLITGASSGIGWELAKLFARDGYNLVLVARNEAKLNELAKELKDRYSITSLVIPADLSDPTTPDAIIAQLREQQISIDILVNNAGFGDWSPFADSRSERQLEMLQVNVTALTHLTHLFLPDMIKKGSGRIMNVASTAAFQPGPFMAVYYASKAYVLSFSEALASELQGTGVAVTTFCPGVTRTNFHQVAGIDKVSPSTLLLMEADRTAEIGYRGFGKGRRMVIPGLANRLLTIFTRFAPRTLVIKAVKKMQAGRKATSA